LPCSNYSFDAAQVPPDTPVLQPGCAKKPFDRRGLTFPNLDHEKAARGEQLPGRCGD
jgi:hypothetical protein